MALALEEGRRAALDGDVPVGALVVRRAQLSLGDETARPMTLQPAGAALRAAGLAQKSWNPRVYPLSRWNPAPCAPGLSSLRALTASSTDAGSGPAPAAHNIVEDGRLNHRLAVTRGVLEKECADLIRSYFRTKRKAGRKK
ncbi:tRNA adenosine(34) deaminase TadA [Aminivibrio sp.]